MAQHHTRSVLLCVFLFTALFLAAPAFAGQPIPPTRGTTTIENAILIRPRSADAAQEQPANLAAVTMSQGFESSWPDAGWRLLDLSNDDGGEYLWGKRSCQPRTGVYAGWSVGGGAQGSILNCGVNYPGNINTWTIYGPINLTSATAATVNYSYSGYTENEPGCAFDAFFVGTSTDDKDYSGVKRCGDLSAGAVNNGYYDSVLDLSSYLGRSQVWVAFTLITDESDHYPGIQIDDIVLNVTTAAGQQRRTYLPFTAKR